MSWASHHAESERFAADAHDALRAGDAERAQGLFIHAARAEVQAFVSLSNDKPRTIGITAVSATALWYKARELEEAERFAHLAGASNALPAFARLELRELLQAIWNEQAQREAGVSFIPGQVIVSVRGGEVVTGGAPLDTILNKVQGVQSLFYRTAEYLKGLPLRIKGQPAKEIQDRYRPWLFQSVPGSYQFAVSIEKPAQQELFALDEPEPELLTDTFMAILRAASEDPEDGLRNIVDQDEYRETFLKMARNLAPTGKTFSELEIRGAGDMKPVLLMSNSRKAITKSLKVDAGSETFNEEEVLHGNLRGVHLDKAYLEITAGTTTLHVTGLSNTVDDIIGPMVNHNVLVRVRRHKGGKLIFVDIEQDE